MREIQVYLLSAVPLVLFHVYTSVFPEGDAFRQQPFSLFREVRGKPARVINHPMAGIFPVKFSHAQYFTHQAGILIFADQPGDLTIGSYAAFRDLLHNGEDFIDQRFIKYLFYGLFFLRT